MDSKIGLLENFALISKIMPYYTNTHNAFLMLSKLWIKTRLKLDEYYHEFWRLMIEFSIDIDIDKNSMER